MGVSRAAGELLVSMAPMTGHVLTLGRQDCVFAPADMTEWAKRHGTSLRSHDARATDERRYATTARPGMTDAAFFGLLGFDRTIALDRSDFEGAELICDLNAPIPQEHHAQFDLVYNGGTLEHVFHLPNALASVFSALRPGGRVVHVAPASNAIDHGFYQFSPTLLFDYYTQNGWELERANLFVAKDFESPWTLYAYEPGCLDALSSRFVEVRASGVTMTGLFFVAKKVAGARCDVIPQQGAYVRTWKDDAPAAQNEPKGLARKVRDAKRKLDAMTPLFNPRAMPVRLGVYGK